MPPTRNAFATPYVEKCQTPPLGEKFVVVYRRLQIFLLESSVRVTCDVGYLCANFSLPIGLSVLDLGPIYATDRRQTDVRRASSLNAPYPRGGRIITERRRRINM